MNSRVLPLRPVHPTRSVWAAWLAALVLVSYPLRAIEIWNGPSLNFTNLMGSDPTLPVNQDRLTLNVWLTRGPTRGLYNAALETSYTSLSPVGTEWAYGALADYASLTYETWVGWNGKDPPSMVGRDAVLHLIPDDTFLAIRFTFWNARAGGFSYTRSTPPVPEPSSGLLFLAGTVTIAGTRFQSARARSPAVTQTSA